ncbi:sensor domain-containing protein [Halofilum ochraceum]|uniref:sensor domain-containing protein n=1 Tax=Halofilum ochraceum TaxID=1611323 RepID=UPI0008DB1DEB|nr:EAL domain-containing protein [Halofilum ochraceum]
MNAAACVLWFAGGLGHERYRGQGMQGESRITSGDVSGTGELVELSPDGVVVSEYTRIRFVNTAGIRLVGASGVDELVGRSLLDFVDPQMYPVVQERLEAVMQGRAVSPLEYALRRLDGETCWIEAQARAIHYEGRRAILTVARDISGRKRAEERYRALFEGAPEAIVISDAHSGTVVDVNSRTESLLGYQRAQLLGQPLDRFFPMAGDSSPEADTPRITTLASARGDPIPVEVHGTRVRDDAGRLLTQTQFRDLTERHQRERETTDRYRVLERIARAAPLNELAHEIASMVERQCEGLRVAVLVRSGRFLIGPDDHDTAIDTALFENADASAITGATDVLLPDSIAAVWHDPPRPAPLHGASITDANGSLLGAIIYGPADHERAPAHDERTRASLAEAIKLAAIAIEQDQLANRLSHQAHHDALTGLPNRTLLMDRIEQALARAVRHGDEVALVMLDLDEFKRINDSLGHATGDQLLEAVGLHLQDCLRADDTVARLGGDEFVLVLPRAGMDQAARVAQKVLEVLDTPTRIANQDLATGASIGISLFPDDGSAPEALLQAADTAMYAAKTAGRNGYRFFAETMNTAVTERLRLENDLRAALDEGHLAIRYQPWVSLADGRVRGAEALVRWEHPIHGLLHPRDFMGICEQARLHRRLDAWVLHQVGLQAAAWRALGRDWRIALNISAVELHDPGFVDMLLRTIERADVSPAALEIEITEHAVMRNSAHTRRQLERLRSGAPGMRIALDNFGRGYSSFTQLRALPIDTLKIDRTFTHELTRTGPVDSARAMLGSLADLGHSLGMEVIAEGIEQYGQHQAAIEARCDGAQGFYFSAPVSAEGLEAYADRGA